MGNEVRAGNQEIEIVDLTCEIDRAEVEPLKDIVEHPPKSPAHDHLSSTQGPNVINGKEGEIDCDKNFEKYLTIA